MIIITVNDFCYVESSYVDRHNEDEYEYLFPFKGTDYYKLHHYLDVVQLLRNIKMLLVD